jgi:hypothetical protein
MGSMEIRQATPLSNATRQRRHGSGPPRLLLLRHLRRSTRTLLPPLWCNQRRQPRRAVRPPAFQVARHQTLK